MKLITATVSIIVDDKIKIGQPLTPEDVILAVHNAVNTPDNPSYGIVHIFVDAKEVREE